MNFQTNTMKLNIALLAGDGIGPEVIDQAVKVSDAIAKKFESVIDPEAMAQLELTQCWGAYYNKTDHAIRHDHKEAEWSFVYYINADKGSSTFDIHEHYEPFDAAEVTLKLEVETNKLIFFRGHVQHSVSPQKSDGERVCIAGNLLVRKPW